MENLHPFFLVIILGIINWLATAFGGSFAFTSSDRLKNIGYSNILAISAGIMLSASFWSLLLPSIELSKNYGLQPTVVSCSGFLFGILFLRYVSSFSTKIFNKHTKNKDNESKKSSTLLILAIAIHNIPEGFIVGVLVSSLASQVNNLDFYAVIALSLTIGLQNIPEGLAVAMPLKTNGKSSLYSFNVAQLTGFIEPVSALFGYLVISQFPAILPYTLAFAGGAMIYVIIDELIPEVSTDDSNSTIIWFSVGFVLMMMLDTILS